MDQAEILAFLLDVVEREGLPYAIAGSHASMAFGEPRLTMDIDILIALTPSSLHGFCQAFADPDFYVSEEGARLAVAQGGMFNIIHPESGVKIDVIVPVDAADRAQLDRVVRAPAFSGREARFISPEDQIIKKMEYYREGGSEKHLRDIAGILKVSGPRVDRAYVMRRASDAGLLDIWNAILQRLSGAQPPTR